MARLLRIYTGAGCHLCDRGRAGAQPVAESRGWQLAAISIAADPGLRERYGRRIPVLQAPSGAELDWPFTPGQVRRLLIAEEGGAGR
ncbi:MAG: glutaredoxin family protein [Pseudomonadota bacterium]